MNNEPVAWMSPDGKVSNTEGKLFYIPLYTHPVKEPTDLELLKMIGEQFTRFGFEGDYVVEDSELIDFAKAILKKAQEK